MISTTSDVLSQPTPRSMKVPTTTFGTLYLHLLRPNSNCQERLRKVRTVSTACDPQVPGSASSLEQLFTQIVGQPVRLSQLQFQALKRITELPSFAALSPWSDRARQEDMPEMVSASMLYDIYLALLKPDGGLTKRFKAVQAAAAMYEPETPGSQALLEEELSRLIGRRVQLSEVQLRCFKELLVDEPAFAHIAPWEDLAASW